MKSRAKSRAPLFRMAAAGSLALLSMLGCGHDFEPPSRVSGPRLLAVVVEPPEAQPGQDITFRALMANPDDEPLSLLFRVDLSSAALAAGAGQTIGSPAAPLTLPSDGPSARLSGAETSRAVEALLAQVEGALPGTPEHVVRYVYEHVGLPLTVELELRDAEGTVVLEGYKRFFLSPRPAAANNPPPPRFAIDGRWVRAFADGSDTCIPEELAPEVRAGAIATLAPEPDEERWLETYPALDLEGELIEEQESAYYSWFSTAGEFASAITRPPQRDVAWTAPDEPGDYPIWLVVRDGHLGTSACRATVHVTAPD